MDRAQKREFVDELSNVFAETVMVVVTHYQGLNVAQATELRRRMRAAGATYRVAKNRLAARALDGTRFEGLKPMLIGPTALVWSSDPVAVAKATVEFSRTNEKLVIVGGSLGERKLDAAGVRALAELPSLDVLRARLVGLISVPATRVAGTLAAPAGSLARVFGAYARAASPETGQPEAA
jgi:large subunit ribosomal protein L10